MVRRIKAARRNTEKFPKRFCFKLTDEESNLFWSQFATKKNNYIETRGGKYKNHRVFTEQGVAMLNTQISITVMD